MAKAGSTGSPTKPGSTRCWRCSARPPLATGERVWDVRCGAGVSNLALSARVGAVGQVTSVDMSEPLIGRALALQERPALFQVAGASSAELPEGPWRAD